MLRKRLDRMKNRIGVEVYSALLAILAGLAVGLLTLVVTNPMQAFPAFAAMLFSGVSQGTVSLGNVVYYSAPIILTGLSVAFAFKTGLFNIGATGQLLIGAFVAIYIGVECPRLGSARWVVALAAAGLAGGLWAFVPGALKAVRGVHEVVTSIMMNYIGLFLTNYLIKHSIYNSLKNETLPVPPGAYIPKMGLDRIFAGSNIQGGIVIALLAVAAVSFILKKTVLGFELKAVGANMHASKYAGISERKSIILSFVISGVLAGLAGGIIYLTDAGRYIKVQDIMPVEGFMGISVALLGLTEPVGVLLAGLFFGYLKVGGQDMQLYDFAPEVIDVITSLIIYFSALSLVFGKWAVRLFRLGKEDS